MHFRIYEVVDPVRRSSPDEQPEHTTCRPKSHQVSRNRRTRRIQPTTASYLCIGSAHTLRLERATTNLSTVSFVTVHPMNYTVKTAFFAYVLSFGTQNRGHIAGTPPPPPPAPSPRCIFVVGSFQHFLLFSCRCASNCARTLLLGASCSELCLVRSVCT